ncbi:SDR family NAD(P)-dependent oxidoreductase [Microvirga flavescens]|uniref:SDR family NAD(P)-dependent oxidoreductase n=1 Tax=Microvirga flavescens TaxID=2249811 RepID=UPI000DD603CC|nr:SDR family NAD(P)-dependent oxidoreductase [Microvirga flavescens]
MTDERMALVIGATGGIGGEAARALLRHGWRVRALTRRPEDAVRRFASLGAIEWVRGDALDRESVIAAADGVQLIVHAANPPQYRDWPKLVLPMLNNSIAAAEASGARIFLPGTVYNFSADSHTLLTEATPQTATTRKGKIRIDMEDALKAASARGVRTLIIRAGDFFGPHTGNSWFSQGLIQPGKPVRSITDPGRPGVGHAWAYLPDVGETLARIMERENSLSDFEVFHFGGHWCDTGNEFAEVIGRVTGNPKLPVRRLPWLAVGAASFFVPLMRELWEMRYLWRVPVRLDNRKLLAFLGHEPHTPLDEAIRTSLAGLGCLPDRSAAPLGMETPRHTS